MNVFGKFHLFGKQVAVGILGQLLGQNQDGIERGAQLVRHIGKKFRFVLGSQSQLGGLFFQRMARLFDLLILALDLGILLGELLGLARQLIVRLLQLLLLSLELRRQLLRLLQQAFRAHGGLDRIEHDADAFRQLGQKGQMRRGKFRQRGQLDDRFGLSLKENRQNDQVARPSFAEARADADVVRRDVGKQDSPLLHGALAHESDAYGQFRLRILISRARVAGQHF